MSFPLTLSLSALVPFHVRAQVTSHAILIIIPLILLFIDVCQIQNAVVAPVQHKTRMKTGKFMIHRTFVCMCCTRK